MDSDEYKFRSKRCDDCGFTEGTVANRSGVTAIKAKLCAETPTPFLCHFNADDSSGQLVVPDGKEVLCQGWVEECNRLEAEGFYQRTPEWKRRLNLAMTDIISEIENGEHGASDMTEYFQRRIMEEANKVPATNS
jgi:hypothetical protein